MFAASQSGGFEHGRPSLADTSARVSARRLRPTLTVTPDPAAVLMSRPKVEPRDAKKNQQPSADAKRGMDVSRQNGCMTKIQHVRNALRSGGFSMCQDKAGGSLHDTLGGVLPSAWLHGACSGRPMVV